MAKPHGHMGGTSTNGARVSPLRSQAARHRALKGSRSERAARIANRASQIYRSQGERSKAHLAASDEHNAKAKQVGSEARFKTGREKFTLQDQEKSHASQAELHKAKAQHATNRQGSVSRRGMRVKGH